MLRHATSKARETMNPLSLSDSQMRMVKHAAGALRPSERDAFLQSVARYLADQPADAAVQAAINAVLSRQPISHFAFDSATKRGERK